MAALARLAAEDGLEVRRGTHDRRSWVQLTGPLKAADADPQIIRVEAENLYAELRRGERVILSWSYKSHALFGGSIESLIYDEIVRLAAEDGKRIERFDVGDIGWGIELLDG